MAEVRSSVIVPLKGKNYPTWKVQCRMALVKDGLWELSMNPILTQELEKLKLAENTSLGETVH